jgi:serine protease Do
LVSRKVAVFSIAGLLLALALALAQGWWPRMLVEPSVQELYSRSKPSVVSVIVAPAGESDSPEARGSGFFVAGHNRVVTSAHVVGESRTVWVRLASGELRKALVVGQDQSSDLALLAVEGVEQIADPLPLGDSSDLQPGDRVLTIGNPLGLDLSLSAGYVSQVGRALAAPNRYRITDIIQFDAAIDHGSSGGPLLNMRGEVVGVTTAVAAERSAFGLAVSSSLLERVLGDLERRGSVSYPWLGAYLLTLEPDMIQRLRLPPQAGVLVVEVVDGSPAARAGLRGSQLAQERSLAGDVIVSFNGEPIRTATELSERIVGSQVGERVRLGIVREGKPLLVEVVLGERP